MARQMSLVSRVGAVRSGGDGSLRRMPSLERAEAGETLGGSGLEVRLADTRNGDVNRTHETPLSTQGLSGYCHTVRCARKRCCECLLPKSHQER